MTIVKELIRSEENGAISFGDYTLSTKTKVSDFEHDGDLYKVKTFKEITRLEKNGMLVYESVPGTAVNNFSANENIMEFEVEGNDDAQIIVELEDEKEYKITVDDKDLGVMKTSLGGKLTFSLELNSEQQSKVYIEKIN